MSKMRLTREQVYDENPAVAKAMKKKGLKAVELDEEEGTVQFYDEEGNDVAVDAAFTAEMKALCDMRGKKKKDKDKKDYEQLGEFMIKKEGSKYCVYDSTGKKKLGEHDSREKALAQLRAIEASKARNHDLDQALFDAGLLFLSHDNVIRDVEIFSAGTHNKMVFTEQDIDDMVTAFKELDFRPALKVGHTKDKPGAPAYGWVTNLTKKVVDGVAKLFATFESMHDSVVAALRRKDYDRVSSEIYFNLERGGKKFRRALKAVALLGAEVPAVAGLVPLHKMEFAAEAGSGCESVAFAEAELDVPPAASIASLEARITGVINFQEEHSEMAKKNAAKIAALEAQVEAFRADMKKLKDKGKKDEDADMQELAVKVAKFEREIAGLKEADAEVEAHAEELKKRDIRIAALEAAARVDKVKAKMATLTLPSLRPVMAAFYELALQAGEAKVAVFEQKEGKEVKIEMTQAEMADKMIAELNDAAKKVFSKLTSSGAQAGDTDLDSDKDPNDIADERARKLQQDKPELYKDKYTEALTAVFAADQKLHQAVVASMPGTPAH